MRCLIMHSFSAQKFLNKLSWVANFEALNFQSTALSYCRQAGRRQQTVHILAVWCTAVRAVASQFVIKCDANTFLEELKLWHCLHASNKRTKQAESVCRYVQVLTRGKKCNLVLLERNYVEVSTASRAGHLAPSSACSTSR